MHPYPRTAEEDRGSTELVVATPVMLLLLALLVQVALWAHADHLTQTIAQHGHAQTRVLEGTEAEGQARAQEVADQLRGELLQELTISVERTGEQARVQVNASVPTVLPSLDWPVSSQVTGPVERAPEEP